MSENSDFFFLNLKQLYPNFLKPAPLDMEIWSEMLEKHTTESIRKALKSYRQGEKGNFIPTPANFKEYLDCFLPRLKKTEDDDLPEFPVSHLMEQDRINNRQKYFYPAYNDGVKYVLGTVLMNTIGEAEFRSLTYKQRYRRAVDLGLFGNFEEILDYVNENGVR